MTSNGFARASYPNVHRLRLCTLTLRLRPTPTSCKSVLFGRAPRVPAIITGNPIAALRSPGHGPYRGARTVEQAIGEIDVKVEHEWVPKPTYSRCPASLVG